MKKIYTVSFEVGAVLPLLDVGHLIKIRIQDKFVVDVVITELKVEDGIED